VSPVHPSLTTKFQVSIIDSNPGESPELTRLSRAEVMIRTCVTIAAHAINKQPLFAKQMSAGSLHRHDDHPC
jgi:hypothetical protein